MPAAILKLLVNSSLCFLFAFLSIFSVSQSLNLSIKLLLSLCKAATASASAGQDRNEHGALFSSILRTFQSEHLAYKVFPYVFYSILDFDQHLYLSKVIITVVIIRYCDRCSANKKKKGKKRGRKLKDVGRCNEWRASHSRPGRGNRGGHEAPVHFFEEGNL